MFIVRGEATLHACSLIMVRLPAASETGKCPRTAGSRVSPVIRKKYVSFACGPGLAFLVGGLCGLRSLSCIVVAALEAGDRPGRRAMSWSYDSRIVLTGANQWETLPESSDIYGPARDVKGLSTAARMGTDAVIYPASS